MSPLITPPHLIQISPCSSPLPHPNAQYSCLNPPRHPIPTHLTLHDQIPLVPLSPHSSSEPHPTSDHSLLSPKLRMLYPLYEIVSVSVTLCHLTPRPSPTPISPIQSLPFPPCPSLAACASNSGLSTRQFKKTISRLTNATLTLQIFRRALGYTSLRTPTCPHAFSLTRLRMRALLSCDSFTLRILASFGSTYGRAEMGRES